jgi:hypothetical protein
MVKKIHAFDIVLIPPKDICRKAVFVSKQLQKKGGLFTLDGIHYFPHITLLAAEFSQDTMPAIKKILEKIAHQTRPFKMAPLQYRQEDRG